MNYQQVGGPWGSVVYLYGNDGLVPPNADDVFRIIDLAGDPVQETNVAEVDEQLATMGAPDQIYGFHHDALRLPNGNTVLLGMTERLITTTAMMGDMLVVLDRNLRVRWYWDAFDHLDTSRGPLLGETCAQDPPGYCSTLPALGTGSPIDWLHTNAISWSPSDDNLVLSLRHQDWIIKIAYENGRGDGHVIWRLGQDGDFRLVPLQPSDPYPWFSHQHDATIVAGTPTTLVLFDNGNVRCATLAPPCNSRGQSYVIDEQTRVVTQTLNADLGVYSAALGSAQRLANGNYAFGAGFLFPGPFAQEMEVTPGGTIVYTGQATGALEYRAWRLRSMFDTINPRCPLC